MQLSQSQKRAQSAELIWKEVLEVVALALQANATRMEGEMQMRAAGDPSMLLAKLHQMEPRKALRLIREHNHDLKLTDLHEATPKQRQQVLNAVLDLFSAT
jgi:hypothetical protein